MSDYETAMRNPLRALLLAGAVLALGLAAPAVQAEELTVYSAHAKEHFAELIAAFQEREPDLTVNQILESTGPITARLMAEAENPRADVILGLSVISLVELEARGMLATYAPEGLGQIKPLFRDSKDPPHWVGSDAWASALCYNLAEGEQNGVPEPASWADLTRPEYRGHIVMPNPSSSGAGLLAVVTWMELWGEDAAWDYMDDLHENISQYVHSGSKPCRMAASGEAVVGVSYPVPGVTAINKGAPLSVVIPEEGIGSDIEGVAILAGARNLDAAQRLLDFTVSAEGAQVHGRYYALLGHEGGGSEPMPNYPEGEEEALIEIDYYWIAQNRDRILSEWQSRYGVKDE